VLDVRRFDARRSRLEGKTKCSGVWLLFIGLGRQWRGGGDSRPAVLVRHRIIGRLWERGREDGLHFMMGKEEEATTL
jgi:hypothetical protein